jgi:Glycoside hydrolase family 5 C-terminal domain
MQFEPASARFELVLDASLLAAGPTELVVPAVHYPDGVTIEVSAGSAHHDAEDGIVRWTLESPAATTVTATLVLQPA